ncbi:hypothetical protein L1987_88967 [Smallanthus sonchifolius]|nr:hypothetical protein L1987_89360 [Smallanthus sonchifolius]KAI3666232.1 hypothetical protein L1987_89280 [Smallanthus sonchifolius]KAI3666485.1 hypothetical protein L1987_89002 [Smallanthus sonchifolius]KAI3666525.1 hypothetical protein L1987_88967 [Smallanthus sonchifolius]
MIWPSRPDHDISLMIWPGRPNHDIEGWDLFSKKKGDSISSSKPFLEDAVRLSASANTTRACTAARREMPVRPSQVLSFEGGSENSKVRSHFLYLRSRNEMEHLLYWSSALSRSSLSRKIIEYIMAFKRFLKVEMNTVLLHKNIGSRYYSQDRVHDPSRLLLVESIKKACDQCSDQFSITADEYDKMIDQIYAGQPGDMIVVAPDPKDIVVIIALTELLFDLCIYQKYTEEERVKSKTDEYKHLNRYHSNLIDMGRTNHDVEPFNDINGMSFISLFGMHCKIVSVGPGDGQIECIGQFGVSVDIDTKNLIFHHQFDSKYCNHKTRFPSTSRAFPSLSQSAGEGSSRAPLTSEDLPLLSQLRRDFIEGVPTGRGLRGVVNENYEKIVVEILTFYKGKYGRLIILVSLGVSTTIWIGIINSTSAVPGAAERDALAVEAKKGIEVRLA